MLAWMPAPAILTAQPTSGSGLLCSAERYGALPVLPAYSGEKYNEIPLKVNLRPYCPPPADQGDMGSCVGWAVGYGALTASLAIRQNVTDAVQLSHMAHSAAFIYNQIKLTDQDCAAGAYIEDALQLLRDQGDCLEQTFNFEGATCRTTPPEEAFAEAGRYRVQDFAALFSLEAGEKEKVATVCKVLAARVPVVVGLEVTPGFWEVRAGQRLWSPDPAEPSRGYHALLVVGYDNVEKQFELMNSFGPGWGAGGFIRMSFADFARQCRYAYVMSLNDMDAALRPAEAPPTEAGDVLRGEFVFRRPVGYLTLPDGSEAPFFEEVEARWQPDARYYEIAGGMQQVGDVFQLVARQIPRGHYVYVFSQSPDGRVQLHFPRRREASFVLSSGAEVAIPTEQTVLQLSAPGDDYLCILYSSRSIADIERRLSGLEADRGVFVNKLKQFFGDLLISPERTYCEAGRMAFRAAPEGRDKHVAAIVLKVTAQ